MGNVSWGFSKKPCQCGKNLTNWLIMESLNAADKTAKIFWSMCISLNIQALYIHFIYVHVCLYVWVHVCTCLQKPERGIGYPGASVTQGCELSSMSARHQTWVLCKSNKEF